MNAIKKSIITAVCAGAAVFAGNAMAADTQNLFIGADVQGVCKFTTTDYLLAFGPIDGSANVDATQVLPISYYCTTGTHAASILVGGALSGVTRLMGQSGPFGPAKLPVTLTWTTPTTVGSGFAPGTTPITFNLTGTIKAADLQAAVASRYIDRTNISILP